MSNKVARPLTLPDPAPWAVHDGFSFWRTSMRRLSFLIGTLIVAFVATGPEAWAQATKTTTPKSASTRQRATPSAPVNLNAATQTQLQTLPGVGAGTAQRILDYRQKNGAFKKIEELMNVKGVGEKSFLKLKPFVSVGTDKTAAAEVQK
jgi:competence protein ComEA